MGWISNRLREAIWFIMGWRGVVVDYDALREALIFDCDRQTRARSGLAANDSRHAAALPRLINVAAEMPADADQTLPP